MTNGSPDHEFRLKSLEGGMTNVYERLRSVDRMEERQANMQEDIKEIRKIVSTGDKLSTRDKIALFGVLGPVAAAVIGAAAVVIQHG